MRMAVVLIAAAVLVTVAVVFLPWYAYTSSAGPAADETQVTGDAWGGQGSLATPANIVLLATALAAAAAGALIALGRMKTSAFWLLSALGVAATTVVVLRMVFTPGIDAVDPSDGTAAVRPDASDEEIGELFDKGGVDTVIGVSGDLSPHYGIWFALVGALAIAISGLIMVARRPRAAARDVPQPPNAPTSSSLSGRGPGAR